MQASFNTGDQKLDSLMESARRKFLAPDPAVRREALEKLWDAFERIKTLGDGADKKAQVESLLQVAIPNDDLRDEIDAEMRALTNLGNKFHIRHSEVTQVEIEREIEVDYLFSRMYSVISLLLESVHWRGGE